MSGTIEGQLRRSKSAIGQKQARAGFYSEGEQLLFVPTLNLWDIRDAAVACDLFRNAEELSIAELRRRIEAQLGRTFGVKFLWDEPFKSQPWLVGWLLRSKRAPAPVWVATRPIIERCRAAWDYTAICREAGITDAVYSKWYRESLSPESCLTFDEPGWRRWLYGEDPPNGCFVVTKGLQRLRNESTPTNIARGAGLHRTILARWAAESQWQEVLARAVAAARKVGGFSMRGDAAWEALDPRMREHMRAYALAATCGACCARAEVKDYTNRKLLAERLGVKEELQRYLSGEALSSTGISYEKVGLVAPRFFIASPALWDFRTAAKNAAASQRIWQREVKDLPGYEQWFMEWTTPIKRKVEADASTAGPPTTSALEPSVVVSPPPQVAVSLPTVRETRKKPCRERDLELLRMREEGNSIGRIVRKWNAHPDHADDQITEGAVKQALRRLRNAGGVQQ
jgi:hypothetical protein